MSQLITLREPRSAAAEAFRSLRTNLMFSSVENPLHTLLVTSAALSDDKSLVAANLAVAFAQGGNKTILVDADLRKPSQHSLWSKDNAQGLADMMLNDGAMANPPLIESGVENLQLLLTGTLPPNPADILSSQRMIQIIGVLKARAHYVFFDSPPVLAATDAALLGAKLSGALMVVKAGHTKREHTLRAKQTLERVHVRLVGAVLGDAPVENDGAYYG